MRGSAAWLWRYPSQEEVEEIGFVQSALSEPLWALLLCDNKCSEQGFKYFQLVAAVLEEGAVRTINLCKQCYNERRDQQGEQPAKAGQWREMMEQKAYRGKLWKARAVGAFHRQKEHGPKQSRQMPREKQEV